MGVATMFRGSRAAAIALILLGFVAPAAAQSVVDPRMAEFDPSPEHHALAPDGTPLVEGYTLALYLAGESTPFETLNLGKPEPDPDGKIRVNFIDLLSTLPAPGVLYEARVSAFGPGGTAASDPSNSFSFSAPCAPSLASTGLSVPAAGGTGSVGMNAAEGCLWTAVSNVAWITISSGSSGSGDGVISFSVAANPNSSSRTGTITASGQTFTVTQAGAACTYSLSSSSQTVPAAGGSLAVTMTAGTGCAWTATSDSAWLTITAGASGTGGKTISLSVAANTGTSSRTGTITAGGQTFSVTQEAAPCTFSLVPTAQSVPAAGGSGSVGVSAGSGCSWTATSSVAWLTVTSGASGSGNGTINYSVASNPTTTSRTGTITAGGKTVTVTQAAAACTYAVAPTSQSMPAEGGTGAVAMTASAGCSWMATSNAAWLTVTSGASGSGNGTINYSVSSNPTTALRTGTITSGGATVTITQAGVACSYALVPTSQSVPAEGGTGTVTMTGTVDCSWTAASSASWITITGGASGTGGGTISFSVAPNAGGDRTGTFTAGGQTFTVSQPGLPCTYTLGPTSQILEAAGGPASVGMTTGAHCSWAVATQPEWITITNGSSGTGSGTVSYTVAENTGSLWRTGVVTIEGQRLTVSQAGVPCTYTLSTAGQSMAAGGGTGSVSVTAADTCYWLANSQASWITIVAGASGAGTRAVSFSVAPNTGTASRTGNLTIAGQTFTVTQDGVAGCSYGLSSTGQSVPAEGGSGTVGVTAGAGCSWSSVSNAPWITLTSGTSGAGSGTISYSVAPNAGSSRTGTISIGDQTFTVTQGGGEACAYVLAPMSQMVAPAGGTASVGVTAGAACAWTAESNVTWMSVAGGASGSGSGTVSYTVAPNTGSTWRTGALTIGGQRFTVSQSGVPCTFTLSSTSESMGASGGTGTVTLTTASTCFWLASSKVSWITITSGTSGSGTRTFTFTVAPNTAGGSRTGTVVIGGQTFTVTQSGQ